MIRSSRRYAFAGSTSIVMPRCRRFLAPEIPLPGKLRVQVGRGAIGAADRKGTRSALRAEND